jgi:hypothetical protein
MCALRRCGRARCQVINADIVAMRAERRKQVGKYANKRQVSMCVNEYVCVRVCVYAYMYCN